VTATSAGGNGQVHGNKNSKVYHLPTCPEYAGMNPASRVTFPTEAEAQQAGYRKAKNCP
jgi:deoxyribonuclease-1